jgi:hypothetical protein
MARNTKQNTIRIILAAARNVYGNGPLWLTMTGVDTGVNDDDDDVVFRLAFL